MPSEMEDKNPSHLPVDSIKVGSYLLSFVAELPPIPTTPTDSFQHVSIVVQGQVSTPVGLIADFRIMVLSLHCLGRTSEHCEVLLQDADNMVIQSRNAENSGDYMSALRFCAEAASKYNCFDHVFNINAV